MLDDAVVVQRSRALVRPRVRLGQLAEWPVVFSAVAALYLLAGWYLTWIAQSYEGDAVSRTAQAGYVILGRDPHLRALGLVWNPLPSLVQVPFVALLHPFGWQLYAGPIQSALAMAATVALLGEFLAFCGLRRRARLVFLLLFGLNPLIILFAANGMSEAMFAFFIVGQLASFVRWALSGRNRSLIAMALMTAGAFGVRYESLPLALVGAAAILFVLLTTGVRSRERIEATLLLYLLPFAYLLALWLFFNWLIAGDPLYFQRSIYSNDAQTATNVGQQTYLVGVAGAPLTALRYAGARIIGTFPAFGVALIAGLIASRRRRWLLGPIALTLTVPLFHTYLLYRGESWGWLRYFLYSVPAAFVLAAPLLGALRAGARRRLATIALVLFFGLSNVACYLVMRAPEMGLQEHYTLERLADPRYPLPVGRSQLDDRAVADYVDRELRGRRILLDTVFGYAIWLLAAHPEQFVIISDRDYAQILAHPAGQVDYLLVPSPRFGTVDSILARYPALYDGGLPALPLAHDFGGEAGWRLFRVLPDPVP